MFNSIFLALNKINSQVFKKVQVTNSTITNTKNIKKKKAP